MNWPACPKSPEKLAEANADYWRAHRAARAAFQGTLLVWREKEKPMICTLQLVCHECGMVVLRTIEWDGHSWLKFGVCECGGSLNVVVNKRNQIVGAADGCLMMIEERAE